MARSCVATEGTASPTPWSDAQRRDGSSQDEALLDLHGLRVTEAVTRTSRFLVAEQARGTVSVKIVTGHGTGALKQAIGDLLRGHPAVAFTRAALRTDAAILVVLNPPRR